MTYVKNTTCSLTDIHSDNFAAADLM
jgi:hypothetical protein